MHIVSVGDSLHKPSILFSGKNKENITNLASAELAQRVVKIKYTCQENIKMSYKIPANKIAFFKRFKNVTENVQ